ncbi:hypothetical protein GQ600_11117 [Phytophthora cactorum]|nr:hypothetical protein GQ600_11117 [Phytophthora cactorum]
MEARDAILSWLEKGDNFLRVTASSPFSPSTRRGRINLRDVVQTECQALNELAAFVNQVLPRSTWDARHAKQMLKDYLMEYRSTAEAAANPQFILDEKDELTGIQTVQDRLNAMCRHFQRLQQLHDPVAIATQERERKRMERGNENLQSNGQRQEQPTATRTTNVKVHVDLTESQHSEREEVVPESDLSNSYENSETDRETALKELRSNSTVTGVADKVQEETQRASKKTAKQVVECVQRHEKDNGEGNKDETVSKLKPSKQKMKVKGKKNVTAAKTTQTQNKQEAKSQKQSKEKDEEGKEDEKFPNVRTTRAKKRSVSKGEGNSPRTTKLRRVETASEKTGTVDVVDLTPTQTTQAATSSASEGSQDSLLNESSNTHSDKNQSLRNKLKTADNVALVSKPAQVANGLLASSSVQVQHTEASRHRRQVAKGAAPFQLGTALAIKNRLKAPFESDSGMSDIDTPSVGPKPSASRSTPYNSKPADTPRSRYKPVPSAGFLPPLIAKPIAFSGKSNIERKRALFRAKELAFEQLKWQRENELQQLELTLLRREMEARQSLAQHELKLQRMRMRADLIQPMISAGASAADIAERLNMTEQQLVSPRGVIVAWLEQGDHFVQATAFSTLAGVYPRRSVAELHAAEQIECQALCELAAAVNAVVPQSHWNGEYARQMLQRYLMEFRAAARQASLPGFTLSTTDEAFGIRTIEDKLNLMCPHFVRLQMLHDPRIRAAMRGGISLERNQERMAEGPAPTTIPVNTPYVAEYTHQGKVMPWEGTADLQSIEDNTPNPPERTEPAKQDHQVKNGMDMAAHSANDSTDQRTEGVVEIKQNNSPKELTTPSKVMKRAVSAKRKQKEQQKKQHEKEKGVRMPSVTALTSDEEEEDLPFFRSKARVIKSPNSDSDEPWLKRKLRCVDASPGRMKPTEVQRTPPRVTRSSDKTPVRVTRSTPNRIKKSPGSARKRAPKITRVSELDKPASKTLEPEGPAAKVEVSSATLKDILATIGATSTASASNAAKESPVESVNGTSPVSEPLNVATSDQPQEAAAVNAPVFHTASKRLDIPCRRRTTVKRNRTTSQNTPVTPAQPRFQVPDALRSAIAQVVSQRQRLLKSRLDRRQIRQPDFSDSDYAPSDREDEEEEEKASTPSSQSTNNVHGPRSRQETPAATVMTAPLNGKFSNQGPPTVSRGSSTASPKATLMAGHIPPLLSVPRTISGDTNLERKRAFFCAKLLAFEQFKWVGENQLQQQEVELLRREMETRKAFVQMEIQLQRTDIRAATIQRMILVGANVEDIAERLTLLTRTRKTEAHQPPQRKKNSKQSQKEATETLFEDDQAVNEAELQLLAIESRRLDFEVVKWKQQQALRRETLKLKSEEINLKETTTKQKQQTQMMELRARLLKALDEAGKPPAEAKKYLAVLEG